MINNKINNTIIFLLLLIMTTVLEYLFLKHSFLNEKEEKKEIIQQIKIIELPINKNELLLKEAQKKSEAEAEQRKKSEAEAERKAYLKGLIGLYIDELRVEIEKNKKYPLLSKTKNEEGIVLVAFRIDKKGIINNLQVIKSSGYEKLDEAALKAVQKGVYKNMPNELEDKYLDIQVPIKFNLN